MRMNGKKDGVLMACYACLLVIGGLLTWLKYDYNTVKMEDVREACGYVSASATPVEAPKIALTFDDGPSAVWTPALLDGLKERGVKATFFLIGENADKNPEIVKRMAEEGHLIGNHTYHHVELIKVSENEARLELADTSAVIVRITGKEPEYMRPPFGTWQRKLEQDIQMLPVLWTIDPLDWTTENQDEIVNKVVTEAEENDIILLHDCYKSSVEAGLRIVDILQEEGFVFVTVDELLLN
ncbi:Probable polysaccharide deacetylase pdaA precursor [uncultured Eubacterium sp.]|nr:Probable polysaccharide deacetylase pdaA precursor [uncultured Eubacterium sp.]